MNIKESFRYANFLNQRKQQIVYTLSDRKFTFKCTETHHEFDATGESVDRVVEDANSSSHCDNLNVEVLTALLCSIFDEYSRLSEAISKAKKSQFIDIDTEIDINKRRRDIASSLTQLANATELTMSEKQYGYRFNVNGDQISYMYPVDKVWSPDYDRVKLKSLARQYSADADATSTKIEKIMVGTELDFVPAWDNQDTIEDMVAAL